MNETSQIQPQNNSDKLDSDEISWEASEYIHHPKNPMWYVVFIVGITAFMGGMFYVLRDILSLVVIGLMAISLLVFANRPPRVLRYRVTHEGIDVGERHYAFDSFRSFSVMHDGGVDSILVDPLQRFMPPITMYFAPEDGQQIVDILSLYLPHQDKQPDIVDQLARKLRF